MKLKALLISVASIFISLAILRFFDSLDFIRRNDTFDYFGVIVYPIVFVIGAAGYLFALKQINTKRQVIYSIVVFVITTLLIYFMFYERIPTSEQYYYQPGSNILPD
jgi:hypothetical protein